MRKLISIASIVIHTCSFALGVIEVIFASKYSGYKHDIEEHHCDNVWAWIVVASVYNITVPIISCCGLACIIGNRCNFPNVDNECLRTRTSVLIILHLCSVSYGIWSLVTYFNINTMCYEFLRSFLPEFWIFIMIHFSVFWISIGVFVIFMCVGYWFNFEDETSETNVTNEIGETTESSAYNALIP